MPVSALKGVGLVELREKIDELLDQTVERDALAPFRLPIDRVFTMQGFGTVVTGTMVSGKVKAGDIVEILPSRLSARVRGVRVHGQKVDEAHAGQRTAVNLAQVTTEEVHRGNTLATVGALVPSLLLDVRLTLLPTVDKELSNRTRVHLYTGTSEVLCRIVLLEHDQLQPGDSTFAQLVIEEPIAVSTKDRFVIRSYSPMTTIGGGVVLDAHPDKRKRFKEKVIDELRVLETGTLEQIMEQYLRKSSAKNISATQLLRVFAQPSIEIEDATERLVSEGFVISLRADDVDYLYHREYLSEIAAVVSRLLDDYHAKYPLRAGMPKEEFRTKTFPQATPKLYASLLLALGEEININIENKTVAMKSYKRALKGKMATVSENILTSLHNQLFTPPPLEEMMESLNAGLEEVKEMLDYLSDIKLVVKVAEGLYFHHAAILRAKDMILAHFSHNSELTLGEFRTMINSSRKYALPLLEYFDQKKMTVRSGECRRLSNSFDTNSLPC
ncbi:MAG: SelB C-terminal domain-containing protein [bacterium]|nr:SelB C-terminal domain-containing protein [bacterium]